jgi:L-fuculose-phosphate aldolase
MTSDIQIMREKICELGRLLYDRNLTNAAGGNLTGAHFRWHLKPEQIIVVTPDGKKLEGSDEMSREAKVHFKLYQEFPQGNGIVHAHARNILAFCAAGVPIPPILEANLALGEIGLCKFAPALTTELAAFVAEALHEKESALAYMAACVMAPWHGIFSLGKTIDAAYEAVEHIEGAAYILLKSGVLATSAPGLAARSALLKEETAKYGKSNE